MRNLMFLVLLTLLFVSDYALAQIPSCPCDTLELPNGTTGNDIIDLLCPGGEPGENTEFRIDKNQVAVFSGNPETSDTLVYSVSQSPGLGQGCGINQDMFSSGIPTTVEEYEDCRISLIERCNVRRISPIPTLSELGMIATAGILGMIGLFFFARRKKAAA